MNKRVVSILFVLIMVISNCTVVFGEDKVTGTYSDETGWSYSQTGDGSTTSNSKDVYANFTALESGAGIYSVDITWGSLQYSYNGAGTWNDSRHEFSGFIGGNWICGVGANKITFKNHSNKKVEVTYGFTKNTDFVTGPVTGMFNEASPCILGSSALGDTDIEKFATLIISGIPETVKSISGKIGYVTVTLSPTP